MQQALQYMKGVALCVDGFASQRQSVFTLCFHCCSSCQQCLSWQRLWTHLTWGTWATTAAAQADIVRVWVERREQAS